MSRSKRGGGVFCSMNEKELRYMQYIKSESPQLDIVKADFCFQDDPNNDLVKINDDLVFKFSKYDWTVALLENEVNTISFIRHTVQIPLPDLERLKKGAVKYKLINGVPLIRQRLLLLTKKEQEDIARQIGRFLREIHFIPMKAIKNSPIYDSPVTRTREEWLEEYEQIRRKVYLYCDPCTKDSIDLTFKPLVENDSFLAFRPAFIHAGLASRNIIFDKESNRINGVTGFDLSGIGDPAYDLSVLLNEYGEAFIRKIGRTYQISDNIMGRARFYAFADRMSWAKKTADMMATRDFTHFQFYLKEGDIAPIARSAYET
ncbi:MAG: aminoglycoside phosphotransferase family protein [Clostridia bacterium]|nr:aminoglycoside phosphotransferase family protein [Clostridia bacterium]